MNIRTFLKHVEKNVVLKLNTFSTAASICYTFYFIWEYFNDYGYSAQTKIEDDIFSSALDGLFFNYITSVFLIVGLTSFFANFGLKQATIKNETHKIYLWLVFGYIQIGTIVCLEGIVLILHTTAIKYYIILTICFILIDAILVFQLLVVQPFYTEEKLVEETNYTRLSAELTSEQNEQHDEFQNVDI